MKALENQKHRMFWILVLPILAGVTVFTADKRDQHALVDKAGLRLLGTDAFPDDVNCSVYIGKLDNPHFLTEGENGIIKRAVIDCGGPSTVSVVKREGTDKEYVLYLFSEDSEKKVVALFDFNLDGSWDVKRTPTREQKTFIRYNDKWLEVDKVEDLFGKQPRAVKNGSMFKFLKDWELLK